MNGTSPSPHYIYDSTKERFVPLSDSEAHAVDHPGHAEQHMSTESGYAQHVFFLSSDGHGATAPYPNDAIDGSSTRQDSSDRIPRPRNAFMLFRSHFWATAKINRSVEHDHRHISRIIGHYWNKMSEEEKDVWRLKAEHEKLEHMRRYPDYRFAPLVRTKKPQKRKVKRNGKDDMLRCRRVADLLHEGKEGEDLADAVNKIKLDPKASEVKEFHSTAPPTDLLALSFPPDMDTYCYSPFSQFSGEYSPQETSLSTSGSAFSVENSISHEGSNYRFAEDAGNDFEPDPLLHEYLEMSDPGFMTEHSTPSTMDRYFPSMTGRFFAPQAPFTQSTDSSYLHPMSSYNEHQNDYLSATPPIITTSHSPVYPTSSTPGYATHSPISTTSSSSPTSPGSQSSAPFSNYPTSSTYKSSGMRTTIQDPHMYTNAAPQQTVYASTGPRYSSAQAVYPGDPEAYDGPSSFNSGN